MIVLDRVSKDFRVNGQRKVVADRISAVFPTGVTVALIGRNGAGKSTLMQIIAGAQSPSSGRIWPDGSISWPVGFQGSFHGDLTGSQNVRFVARIYGVDTDALVSFVEDFAELGGHYHLPIRTYSSGMKSRLAFGVSMGIRFDTYLVDEVTSVGDEGFRRKSEAVFMDRMQTSGAIVVSHSMELLRRTCTMGAVLEGGRLTLYDNVNKAVEQHMRHME